jgi:hypothetical protein
MPLSDSPRSIDNRHLEDRLRHVNCERRSHELSSLLAYVATNDLRGCKMQAAGGDIASLERARERLVTAETVVGAGSSTGRSLGGGGPSRVYVQ